MIIQQRIFPIFKAFFALSVLIAAAVACTPTPPPAEPPNSPTEEDTPPPPPEDGQTPGGPVNYPEMWQAFLKNNDFQGLVASTTTFIDEGNSESSFIGEAYLYRGLAQLQLGYQKEAQKDLDTALQYEDRLTSLDKTQEQILLYRGLAVVNAQLGNMDLVTLYRDKAGALDPNVVALIQSEIDNKALEKSKLDIAPSK